MKKRLLILLVLALVLGVACAKKGRAPSREVFGLELGAPFSIPECEVTEGDYTFYRRGGLVDTPCFIEGLTRSGDVDPKTQDSQVWIIFPESEWPDILTSLPLSLLAWSIDGRLEAVHLVTNGWKTAENDLEELIRKFGNPHKLSKTPMQNALGATFERIDAEWEFSDLTVQFRSLVETIDSGAILVETPEFQRWSIGKGAERRKGRRPL